jgi:hypothetical protein
MLFEIRRFVTGRHNSVKDESARGGAGRIALGLMLLLGAAALPSPSVAAGGSVHFVTERDVPYWEEREERGERAGRRPRSDAGRLRSVLRSVPRGVERGGACHLHSQPLLARTPTGSSDCQIVCAGVAEGRSFRRDSSTSAGASG